MSGYIGTQPVPQATQTRDSFTATSGQTSFATGGYTPNFLDVYLNGVKLAAADYTATNGSDVVLASGAATGDILEVVAYTTFTVGSSFTPSIDDNGNATAITIDSNENVGIGSTSPSFESGTGTGLEIRNAGGNGAHIKLTDTASGSGGTNGFDLYTFNTSGYIENYEAGSIVFRNNGSERMRLDSSGNVLVGGHTSTHSPVENGGSGVSLLSNGQILAGGEYPSYFNRENSDGDIIVLRKDGSAVGSIGTNGSTLYIGSTEGADAHLGFGNQIIRPVTSSGASRDNAIDLGYNGMRFRDAYLSGGVYLGGTGAANKLDDYEEGTWTPTVGTGTMTSNFAHYTKVGNQVTISCVVYSFSDRSSTNGVGIQNLPFTSSSTARSTGSVMIRNSDNTTITASYITSSSNTVEFYGVTTGFWDQLKHNDLNSTDSELYFNITYRTDA